MQKALQPTVTLQYLLRRALNCWTYSAEQTLQSAESRQEDLRQVSPQCIYRADRCMKLGFSESSGCWNMPAALSSGTGWLYNVCCGTELLLKLQAVTGLYLDDASNSDKAVLRYSFFGECKINVDSDEAGIGWHPEWVWPVAEIALFESKYLSPPCAVYREAPEELAQASHPLCAGRDPQDPEYPRLKPLGVYPVIDGWAHFNLEEVAGKGQEFDSPCTLRQVRLCTSALQARMDVRNACLR